MKKMLMRKGFGQCPGLCRPLIHTHTHTLEVCMGRPMWQKSRPGLKEKLKFQSVPSPVNFFPDLGLESLGLGDFKTDPFSCLYIIN